ncbi:MAG: M4 family metallopeptidase [Verrucomicrobia bacterium]|nr:M4 family metallopeptidase [Verrucomicrobiota bacterium]
MVPAKKKSSLNHTGFCRKFLPRWTGFLSQHRRPATIGLLLVGVLLGLWSTFRFVIDASQPPDARLAMAVEANSASNAAQVTPVPLAQAIPLRGSNGTSARTTPDPDAVLLAQRMQGALAMVAQGHAGPTPTLPPVPTNSHSNPSLVPPPARFSDAQLAALSDLRWRSGKQLEVRGNADNNTIRYLEGLSLERPAETPAPRQTLAETTAGNFLQRNRELLLLSNPGEELARTQETRDELGYTQIRYEQRHAGLPVWPAGLTVQLDRAGHAHLLTGAYVPTPEGLELEPRLPAADAGDLAQQRVGVNSLAPIERQELIIYAPIDGTTRLAYKVEMHTTPLDHWLVVVDAATGEIVESINKVCTAATVGSGTDEGGQTRSVNLWSANNRHYLVDASKPMFNGVTGNPPSPGNTFGGIIILDAKGVNPLVNAAAFAPEVISSTSTNSGFPASSISASFNLSVVYDYFLQRHQRNSIDGQGGTIRGVVEVPVDNGFWSQGTILLGNADHYANSLDFVAHEMAHGVTERTANLIYRDQSGAMNEAFSDIFGEATEAFHRGTPDWKFGSQLSKQMRDLKNPNAFDVRPGRPFPARMSQFITVNDPILDTFTGRDNGGVHFNSSIINHAFYQLVEGLPGAIGMAAAERIFYRALTTKLQQQSQFIDCRLACVQSAVEIFGAGSPQAIRTGEAFNAVEIFDQAPPPGPTPVVGVAGPDSLIFTYVDQFSGLSFLARREAALGDPATGVTLSPVAMAPRKRPAVLADGSSVMVVTANNDMALVNTQTGQGQSLGFAGLVWSVGLSVDGQFAAIILRDAFGQPRNQINVIRLGTQQVETYNLLAPALDGGSLATVLYGDTLDFSLDGGFLYYDALNRLRFSDGTIFDNWSIYVIDRSTGAEFMVVRPVPGVNIGNPSLGQIHNHRLVYEAQNPQLARSTIYGLNAQSGQSGVLFTVNNGTLGIGYPNLNGDDTQLYFSDFFSNLAVIGTIGLTSDGLSFTGNAGPTLSLNQAAGPLIGAVYRRGTFSGLPSVQVTATVPTTSEAGGSPGLFTLTRTGSTAAALPLQFVLTGTAGNGTDYFGTALSVNIAAGSANTTVTILPFNDTLVEGDETVILTLTPASHYVVGGAGTATVTIIDDDQPANAFEAWALTNNVVGVNGNEDLDDYNNLTEFALGTNPKVANPPGLIRGELRTVGQQRFLSLVVSRQTNNPAVQFIVEVADSVTGPWNSGPAHTTIVTNTQSQFIVRDNSPITTKARRFMRLKLALL